MRPDTRPIPTTHEPRPPRHPARRAGFTLIESLVAVAAGAVLATTALPSFARWLDQQRLQGAAHQLLADLQFVRTEAVSRQQGLRLSVMPPSASGGSCYVLHTGGAGACSCAPGGTAPAVCGGGAQEVKTVRWGDADRVVLSASAHSILFDPHDGTSTPTVTLDLGNPQGQQLRHVVNVMGRARTCSPNDSVPGHPIC